jgi:cysteine desulfurase family protein (TIGR01976 family)
MAVMALDIAPIKQQFPALARTVADQPAVFADAPGGTQVPRSVIDAMVRYLERSNANEGGAFITSQETDELIEQARRAAADLLGANPGEIAFGPNMTTLAFALSRALGRRLSSGDEVVVTRLDHDANVSPWVLAARDAGATVRWVEIDPWDCTLRYESLEEVINENTRIVAFTVASNAVGTITDASRIVEHARRVGALAIADAVHYAPHGSIDVHDLGVDVLFCSPYKFFGPHMGVMYGRGRLLHEWTPYKVRPSKNEAPHRWETGTKNHEALAGLVACVDYIASIAGTGSDRRDDLKRSMHAVFTHERELARAFLEGTSKIEGLQLYGIGDIDRVDERTPTFALRVPDRSPAEVAAALGEEGIFVWDGNYYAIELMESLDLEDSGGAVRIGFCHYHSLDEVERVVNALARLTT